MFIPNQVSQTLTFYAEMTLSIILILLLHCSHVNENLNLPVTIVYSTVLAPMQTMQRGSGHTIIHPSELLWLHLFLWCQYYGICGQLREDYGCGAVQMGDSEASIADGETESLLPILAPVPMPTILWLSTYQINPLHGPTHFRWRLLKLFGTRDQLSSCTRSATETLSGKKTQKPAPAFGCLERN